MLRRMPLTRRRLVINGVTTYVEAAGAGPVLVIVHGWAADRSLWKAHQRALADRCRVVLYDLRGHGDAGKPDDVPYTIPQFADDLRAVLDALGLERVSLLGHSMGGQVCQEFALAHPDRVDRLILSATTMGKGDPAAPEAQDMLDMLRDGGFDDFIEFGADLWFSAPVPQETIALSQTAARRCPAYVATAAMESALGWTSRDRLAALTAPTLVIAGAEDMTESQDAYRALADALPNGSLTLLDGLGHDCYLEAPDAYREAVTGFLLMR